MTNLLSSIENMATNEAIITILYATNILLPTFIAGTSTALSTWVIPIILINQSPKNSIDHFNTTVVKGSRFLQPLSRFLVASFAILTFLTAISMDSFVAGRWKCWAWGTVVLVANAPCEVMAVFPINDGAEILGKKTKGRDLYEGERKELVALLRSWQRWSMGRVALRFVARVIAVWTAFDTLVGA